MEVVFGCGFPASECLEAEGWCVACLRMVPTRRLSLRAAAAGMKHSARRGDVREGCVGRAEGWELLEDREPTDWLERSEAVGWIWSLAYFVQPILPEVWLSKPLWEAPERVLVSPGV